MVLRRKWARHLLLPPLLGLPPQVLALHCTALHCTSLYVQYIALRTELLCKSLQWMSLQTVLYWYFTHNIVCQVPQCQLYHSKGEVCMYKLPHTSQHQTKLHCTALQFTTPPNLRASGLSELSCSILVLYTALVQFSVLQCSVFPSILNTLLASTMTNIMINGENVSIFQVMQIFSYFYWVLKSILVYFLKVPKPLDS